MSAGLAALRREAQRLDEEDALAPFLDRFVSPPPGDDGQRLVYLDGNSLGPPPVGARDAVTEELDRWATRLIGGWNDRWLDLARSAAAVLAPVLGAPPEAVWVGDSTSVNLVKVVGALQAAQHRRVDVATTAGNFPTDRYLLQSIADAAGGRLRVADAATADALAAVVDDDVSVLSLSVVDFRTGELADVAAITDAAHRRGVSVVWDCSHAAGVVPLELAAHGVDAAVGCSYKYLNGGPGAPAWLFVRPDLIASLDNPLPGWFGHRDPFALADRYQPAAGVDRFAVGTPPVLSLAAALPGLALAGEAGVEAARAKSLSLTGLLLEAAAAALVPLGFSTPTPVAAHRRGSHVSLRHPDAWAVTQLGVRELGVVGDFRQPDLLRLGCSPLPLRHVDVVEAVERLAVAVTDGRHRSHRGARPGVT